MGMAESAVLKGLRGMAGQKRKSLLEKKL